MFEIIIMLVLMVVVFYFFVIRPQKKQEKETTDMRNSIKVGDEIITIGGIIGTVIIIKDDKMMIETGNDRSKLTILKSAVRSVIPDEDEVSAPAPVKTDKKDDKKSKKN